MLFEPYVLVTEWPPIGKTAVHSAYEFVPTSVFGVCISC